MRPIEKIVGENVAKYRKSKGITQDVLAQALGTTRATINRIEKGHQWPQADTLKGLAKALGVPDLALFAVTKEQLHDHVWHFADVVGVTLEELRDALLEKHPVTPPTIESLTKIIQDQEKRIKELESARPKAIGLAALIEKIPPEYVDVVKDLIETNSPQAYKGLIRALRGIKRAGQQEKKEEKA